MTDWLPNAYPIELAQMLVAVVGVYYSTRGIIEAWRDLQFLEVSGLNGARSFVASRNIFEETVRLIIHLLLLFNGIIVVLYPPGPGLVLPADRYFQMMVTRWVTTLTGLLLTAKSYRDVRDRARVRDILSQRIRARQDAADNSPERP